MNKTIFAGVVSGLMGAAPAAMAGASYDGSQTLLCATGQVIECDALIECIRVPAEAVNAPDFLRLDFKARQVTSMAASKDQRSTPIERVEQVDNKLILQGAEDGRADVRDGLGWTIAIAQDSGKMVFTASGDEVAFVAFGACTPL